MEKYDIVLEIIEHPENYTEEQLREILSDTETREIYNLLCKTESAVKAQRQVDVDAEWQAFASSHEQKRRHVLWFGSRAASITAFVATSLVAAAIGVAVTVSVVSHSSAESQNESDNIAVSKSAAKTLINNDTITIKPNSAGTITEPVMFEDETLQTIMETIANAYGVEVKFNNQDVASLHLHYKLNPALPLDEIIKQLNTFKQINITRNGNTVNID